MSLFERASNLSPDASADAKRAELPTFLAGVAWFAAAYVAREWPDLSDWSETNAFSLVVGAIGFSILAAQLTGRIVGRRFKRLERWAPWLIVTGLGVTLWELASAKFGWAPPAFFPPPQELLEVYKDDFSRLAEGVAASSKLLAGGFVIGAALGFVTGVSIGWSQRAGYWVHPLLRFIGPIPASAWAPIAFFAFPSSQSAGIFLIALATGFPVAVLTWSGVASVPNSYYDVARTLGAGPWFLVLRIAIPGALAHVFVGLFMAIGASFSVLMVAELLGGRGGLSFYLNWAQGWAQYGNVYAALIVLTLWSSATITLLFVVRNRLLSWQKGLVKW